MAEPSSASGADLQEGVAPLADLLFAVATIVIALLVAVLPTIAARPPASPSRLALVEAVVGRTDAALVLVAASDGVTISDRRGGTPRTRTIPVAAILDDASLGAVLAASADGAPPVLLIEESGAEAAFLLEGRFAAAGLPAVRTLRLAFDDGGAP